MPKEIYNEGRVVGMSAYEIYLRHQLSEYPDMTPSTEREWLSSTIGMGCSLILKVPAGVSGTFEMQLPENSTLCAASSITASIFDGEVELDRTGFWGTKVISYGPLISNTEGSHPSTPGEGRDVPEGDEWTSEQRAKFADYMKIVDGIVYQPGEWTENEDKQPYMDFKPDLTKRGYIRLQVARSLSNSVCLLITGWVHRPIVAGSTKLDTGSLDAIHPWNGDFLGAERFPWAVKIAFTVSTEVMHILNEKAYIRQLDTGSADKSVSAKALIDYDSGNLFSFYNQSMKLDYPDAPIKSAVPLKVTELNVTGDEASIIGAFQRDDIHSGNWTAQMYPPVIYGAKVNHTGDQYMVPLDVAAPGTVKMFEKQDAATNYPKVVPNTYAFWHDKESKSIYFIEGDTIVSMDTKLETKNIGTVALPKYASIIKSGDREVQAVSLLDAAGNSLDTNGTAGKLTVAESDASAADRNLSWTDLLASLGANKTLDVIGAELHRFRKNLPNVTSGTNGLLSISGQGASSIAGTLHIGKGLGVNENAVISGGAVIDSAIYGVNAATNDAEFKFNKPIRSGADYIVFSNGLRLYISAAAPSTAGVPVGSIGIGW